MPVFAEGTGYAIYETPHEGLTQFMNEQKFMLHKHDAPERENPMGAGVDLILYEFQNTKWLNEIKVEARHDFRNNETSVFAVIEIPINKLFQK